MTDAEQLLPESMSPLEHLGTALRELQDVATTTGAPEEVVAAAAQSIQAITEQLRPFVTEVGTEHDFEQYVRTSGSHTLNPPMEILRQGEGFIEMSVCFGRFYRNAFGYVNGGAIAIMFDTAIAHVAFAHAGRSYTANLNIDYRNLAPIDTVLLVKVRMESTEGRKHVIAAELFNGDVLVSEAHSLLIEARN